jgi:hypothetical protein
MWTEQMQSGMAWKRSSVRSRSGPPIPLLTATWRHRRVFSNDSKPCQRGTNALFRMLLGLRGLVPLNELTERGDPDRRRRTIAGAGMFSRQPLHWTTTRFELSGPGNMETSIGNKRRTSSTAIGPWNLIAFHAYRGYGFTHKRGIEADQTRITGVSSTHN